MLRAGAATVLATTAFAGLGVSASATVAPPAELTMTGNAFALSMLSSGMLSPASVPGSPDTGAVESTASGTYDAPCGVDLPPTVVVAKGMCAGVTTGAAPDTSMATATAQEVNVVIPGLPQISLTGLRAQSITACGGSKAIGNVSELRIDGQSVPLSLGPNTAFDIAGQAGVSAKLVINEQIQSPDQLTVNAARVIVTGGGMAGTDIVIASATSGVKNCAPTVVSPVVAPVAPAAPNAPAAQPPLTYTTPELSGLTPPASAERTKGIRAVK